MPQLPIPQRESTLERIRARRERRRRRRTLFGRLAALAAIIAVPALAAPDAWGEFSEAPAEETGAMPFETPGESFPGSAFYYLADEPYLPLPAEAEIHTETDLPPLGSLPSASQEARELVAASPFRFGGTSEDQARALKCLAMAVYYEAASESDAGQRAVAQVVLNRVSHPTYPNSVCGVVFQGAERRTGCQFTFTCDGSLGRKPSRLFWDRAERVARNALHGAVYRPVGLATHYHTLAVNPYWASSLDTVGVIGFHRFYRWRGAAGRPAAFHASYTMREPSPRADSSGAASQAGPDNPGLPTTAPAAADTAPALREAAIPPELPKIPQSGTVRAEYADSGSWIARP